MMSMSCKVAPDLNSQSIRDDLVDTHNGIVSYSTDSVFSHQPSLLTLSTLHKPPANGGSSNRLPFSKTVSLKTFNAIARSIKSKFSPEKATPTKQHSRSVECILAADNSSQFSRSHSDEEQNNMPTLRRVESERNAIIRSPRQRPASLYTSSTVENSKPTLSHAQSFDGLNQKYDESNRPVKHSHYHQSSLAAVSSSHNIGNHQRSMSHRELTHHPDGIVDAFGFAASNGYPSVYQSTSNIHYGRSEQMHDFQHRKPPEVPRTSTNYQPAPPVRHDSRSYKVERSWRPPLQYQTSAPTPTAEQETFSTAANMDKENYPNQRKTSWDPPRQQRNSFISANRETQRQASAHPVSKNSFGPVVKRAESMKRIMQKNRKSENANSPAVSNSFDGGGNEVVTEKGRSVKSIVGMFDQQPAIHAALAKAKVQQANNSLNEEKQTNEKTTPQHANTNGVRSDRNGTQLVHIAKFVQLETTPEKPTNYTDAQTSPMQLSPTELFSTQRARPSIAKAETFSGGSKPKVAVMTSSTSSSYMSNEVFTPERESPVFEADLPYHRTDSSGRTHYSDSGVHEGYDLAHNSYIPNSHNQSYSPQHPHIHSQLMRQEQTDAESSNHYEDLESLRATGSIHEMENIYEPISPMRREPSNGNYMNFPTTPSNAEYIDMSPTHVGHLPKQGSVADRPSLDSGHTRPSSLPMDSHSPRHFSVANGDNETQEEESYSNQVREASHRTLRQTSVEGSKFRSPTWEEQVINRYNIVNTKVNPVAPVQGTTRSTAPIRPQVQSPYNSEGSITNQEPVNMRKRPVPQRTDSCRVPPRTKQIDRTSSYRESRGSSIDLRGNDHKAAIRDNLIDFYKRKSRDSSMDVTLDNLSGQPMHSSASTPTIAQSPTKSAHGVPMHRIQSERTFSTRNMANPRGTSLDRTPSMQAPNHHRNSVDMTDGRRSDSTHSYMQSWDASAVANRSSSSTSSERSPNGPLVQNESPRVKKPLVAEVSPFSMPVQKSRKDRPSRLDPNTSSSNAGSGVLKPMKASATHADNGNNNDVAPTLPPRNYHPEEITTSHGSHGPSSDNKSSNSELDLSAKPYQNVFNGSGSGKTGAEDDDAGYTEALRRLAKHQYVPKSSPQQQLPPRANGQQLSPQNMHSSSPSQQSPLSSTHNNMMSAHNATPSTVMSPHNATPSTVMSPHNATPSNVLSQHGMMPAKVQHRHSISVSSPSSSHVSKPIPRQQFISTERSQILETDIDGPASPEIQPLPPPRRPAKEFDYSKPPPKPPKLSTTIYHPEINHNDPSTISAANLNDTPQPFVDRIENNVDTSTELPSMHHKKSLQLSSRLHEGLQSTPQPQARKERGRSESMISPKGVDLTVTSGDPTAHLNRRHSVGKARNKRSVSAASSCGSKEEKFTPNAYKPSLTSRLHQRETEFSAIEKPEQAANERLQPHVLSNVINDNRPKPFDRYNPVSSSHENLVSHSRHGSTELLDTLSNSPSPVNYRQKDRLSPTPAPRSPKLSPVTNRSVRASIGSLCDSRKSTPSPHSSSSDVARQAKSDPSTPVDKTFVPISAEILAELAGQGIDITEKHNQGISDENKARLVKISALNSSSPPASKKAPFVKHIRQKSSDEILCDTQVENLGKSIKDETLSQVLSKPERGTTDYLPGLFDDLLNKNIPRKPRQSVDSSPCHSKQSSDGDSLVSSKTSSTKDYESSFDADIKPLQDQKEELVLVLKKKLSVLQGDERFIKQEIEDNENSGTELVQLVETKCNEKEVRKFKSYMDDVETITRLLLKLSRRLARAENELRNAPMDATDDDKKCLEQKRNGLQRQHTEAKTLKGNIDRRKGLVDSFLNRCLDSTEFEQYDHYVSIKLKLIMEISDIEDQVSHCEEQITAVTASSK